MSTRLSTEAVSKLATPAFIGDSVDGRVLALVAEVRESWRERDAARRALRDLTAALQATRDELNRWGMGDMHYGNMPQEKRVVDAVAAADEALAAARAVLSENRSSE